MAQPEFAPFVKPVPRLFDTYHGVVPVPITLELMHARAVSSYYRQLDSFYHDIHLLVDNCVLFNQPEAAIVPVAEGLRATLLERVRNAESAAPPTRARATVHTTTLSWPVNGLP